MRKLSENNKKYKNGELMANLASQARPGHRPARSARPARPAREGGREGGREGATRNACNFLKLEGGGNHESRIIPA